MSLGKLRTEYLDALREGNKARLDMYEEAESELNRVRQEATDAHMQCVIARTEATHAFREEARRK